MTTPIDCRDCRSLLPGYLDRELAREDRSNVAAHLDGCDRCHAEYARQRDVLAGLRADLPGLGRLEPSRAGALWLSVQGELRAPRRVAWPLSQRPMSLLALLVAAALVLPWALSPGHLSALSLPLPPTPGAVEAPATVAPITDVRVAETTLLVTPPSRPEYAPTQAAAETVLPEPSPRLTSSTQAR
jgi:anti-sigma factor RsiW